MTRDLRRAISRYVFSGTLLAVALAFVFDELANRLLHLVGYSNLFVSSFPPIRNLYFYLSSSGAMESVSIADFHILDIFLWWSIALWALRLVTGLLYLKEHDDLYRVLSNHLAEQYPGGHRLVLYVLAALAIFAPFFDAAGDYT